MWLFLDHKNSGPGAVFSLQFVWDLSDLANGLMAIPNLISLIALNGVIVSETEKYLWNNNLDMIFEEDAA